SEEFDSEEFDFVHFRKQSFTSTIPYKKCVFDSVLEDFKIDRSNIQEVITQKIALASCTVMWKKEAIGDQRFEPNLLYAEEWEFYTRLILRGATGVKINNILYFNRKHAKSNTGAFFLNDKSRVQSKIEASKLIISSLNRFKLLNSDLVRFFCWESVRFKDKSLFQHLVNQPSLTWGNSIKARILYLASPIVKSWIKLKKR
ncbi:MAG: hypothetical protein WA951_14405, partial [Leeuwenhoekiella sp.]